MNGYGYGYGAVLKTYVFYCKFVLACSPDRDLKIPSPTSFFDPESRTAKRLVLCNIRRETVSEASP